MTIRHISYFLTLAIFWGGSFLGIHYVVESFPPAMGAFFRVLVALSAVLILMLTQSKVKIPAKIKWQAFGAGIFNMGLSWIFLFYGEKVVSPALSSIYNSSSTVFAALLAPILLVNSRLTKKNLLGVLLGFIGILIIFGPNISSGGTSMLEGQFELLGMAICYSIGVTWVKRFSGEIRATTNLFYQSLGALTVLGIFSMAFEHPWNVNLLNIHPAAYISLLYLGICSTFIAWLFFIRLIHERGSVQASSVTYIIPLVSIVLDFIFLGKMVRPTDIFGVCVILAGVWLIQSKKGILS